MPALNGNILVTDDDPDLRRVLRRTLDALGFEVAESSNGEQALKQVETHQFHAILLDVNMPGAGGIATCREMRRKDPRLQILMLTVRDREADKIEALDAGADDYITKPFSIPELAARLRSAVRRSTTTEPDPGAPITIGDIELDPAHRTVRIAAAPVVRSQFQKRYLPEGGDHLRVAVRHHGNGGGGIPDGLAALLADCRRVRDNPGPQGLAVLHGAARHVSRLLVLSQRRQHRDRQAGLQLSDRKSTRLN